ncbi:MULTISPECIES: adenylate/guanylate cyclase domain-containing protein [Paenarthrobacter]|jgi:adenylate cyclase|uniref:adenylate/guanylate cyclase domain-containing protein n=1 Tax=Paenarthrobacter TaxID=1742992 RepID=UPI00140C456D|nr:MULTISPECIES: adenylate/guanylate cyclase domain-containing protein [Paenarthrobacter]MCW3764861.1 adenylate/guanylate cyclase domain-containing protein [Paenarthrobacter sp. PAE-2]MCX8456254.1 adenylate/guanylate cyclase domain-containing protein [Paenarthrobacter ureafaciens]MCY0972049.1 adenylate/guanylate cyclase domain-containing protein [Paenarthrobacter ureafaciens]UOD82518.1 adenylate/guanylate cyclase domain-containing protein [Paenarthrobacter ureafaciens]WNZ02218.1 adenylate/guan
MSVEDQSDEDLDQEFDAVPEPSGDEDAVPDPAKAIPTGPPTGVMSAERLAIKALEARLLGGERKLRRREIAAGAGVSVLSARKLWRALGFPNFGDDDVAFTERDQAALTTILDLVRAGLLTEEAAISITRSIGQMTDRMVVWQIEALVEDMVQEQGISDAVARKQLVGQLPALVDSLEEILVYSYRRQLNAGVQRLAVRAEAGLQASEEGREGDEDDSPLPLARAVGFADLVSYTSLSRRMNEKTLAQMVQRFENKCAEIISIGGGRLVKTVGDEVLYIAETPAAGAEISLALAQAFTEDEILPQARVSMVWGRILSRLGDIYGPTVNLAARLTSLAQPGTVLVDAMTAAALGQDERFVLIPQASENVRGFGEIHPVMLARGRGKGLVLD